MAGVKGSFNMSQNCGTFRNIDIHASFTHIKSSAKEIPSTLRTYEAVTFCLLVHARD